MIHELVCTITNRRSLVSQGMVTKTTQLIRSDEGIAGPWHPRRAYLADRRCPAERHRRRIGSRVFLQRVGTYSSVGSFSRGRRQISPLKSPLDESPRGRGCYAGFCPRQHSPCWSRTGDNKLHLRLVLLFRLLTRDRLVKGLAPYSPRGQLNRSEHTQPALTSSHDLEIDSPFHNLLARHSLNRRVRIPSCRV